MTTSVKMTSRQALDRLVEYEELFALKQKVGMAGMSFDERQRMVFARADILRHMTK